MATTPGTTKQPRTPRRKPEAETTDEVVLSTFDENAPLPENHPFLKATAQEPAAATATASEVSEPLPASVTAAISEVIGLLSDDDKTLANLKLSEAIQLYLGKLTSELEAMNTRQVAEYKQLLLDGWKKVEAEKIKELERAYGPVSNEDMQKLLSQEYITFKVTVQYHDNEDSEDDYRDEVFTIRELPQSVEKDILSILTVQVVPLMSKIQGIKFTAGSTTADKITQAIKVVPELVDIMADIVKTCLNPYNKKTYVTRAWAQQNISSSRQVHIIDAQFTANRIRDFFYVVSRVIPKT